MSDFLLVEARDQLGGRFMSRTLENRIILELGANWIEGPIPVRFLVLWSRTILMGA
jgi:hypothetical protein